MAKFKVSNGKKVRTEAWKDLSILQDALETLNAPKAIIEEVSRIKTNLFVPTTVNINKDKMSEYLAGLQKEAEEWEQRVRNLVTVESWEKRPNPSEL